MNNIKNFEVVIDSMLLNFSMQPIIPTVNGNTVPMELVFLIEDPEGIMKPIVIIIEKDEAVGILKELQRLIPLIKCFG